MRHTASSTRWRFDTRLRLLGSPMRDLPFLLMNSNGAEDDKNV
jgi:hypothetical protein